MKNFPICSRKRDPNVDWHRWFAWYPVDVRFERRWLTFVERKWHTNEKGHAKWRYRAATTSSAPSGKERTT